MSNNAEILKQAQSLHRTGRLREAAELLERAIAADSKVAELHYLLGAVRHDQGDRANSILCLQQAARLAPQSHEVHRDLAMLLAQQGRLDESAECFRRAIALKPDWAHGHYLLGRILFQQGHFAAAVDCCRQAVGRQPESADALTVLGAALVKLGNPDEAMVCFERAIQIEPNHLQAHYNRATTLLLKGEFASGWAAFEARFEPHGAQQRAFSAKRWRGEPLEGRTLLVYAEQGLGDTLQFVRYVELLEKRGAKRVIIEAQPALIPLLAQSGFENLVAQGAAQGEFDCEVPLLSLPAALGTTLETVPRRVPYLSADPALVDAWRPKLRGVSGVKVGIAWQGSPLQKDDRFRSMPLACFAALARPGVELVSLQKGPGEEQLAAIRFPVRSLGPGFDERSGPFMDTAAAIASLDLVITCDTAVAHLAGALGARVWVALPCAADWRWMLGRTDSPWYPTMRLFRQQQSGDWQGVFAAMADELAGMC